MRSILEYSILTFWRRQWHPTPVLLPGKSHGQRSLVGCSPWGREESDTTERLLFHFSLSCIGEGNGNPLQCACLENPRDRAAWWAAICGVAQSWTWLKQLSSRSILIFAMFYLTKTIFKLKLRLKYYLNNLLWTDCIPPPPLQIHILMPSTPNWLFLELGSLHK